VPDHQQLPLAGPGRGWLAGWLGLAGQGANSAEWSRVRENNNDNENENNNNKKKKKKKKKKESYDWEMALCLFR